MSKAFVWKSIGHLTIDWHDGGGAMVIAETEVEAAALLPHCEDGEVTPVCADCKTERLTADREFELMDNHEPEVFIFADRGCC